MIVEKTFKSVGDWLFQDSSRQVAERDKLSLFKFLEKCQEVLLVLKHYQLLYPHKLSMDMWRYTHPITKDSKRIMEEPAQSFDIPPEVGAQGFLVFCKEVLGQLEQHRPFLYPNEIKVEGTGLIYVSENQTRELPDVTWVNADTGGHQWIEVGTQSDAWMPCNLRGEPQPEIYRLNAPRFEAALTEIYSRLGFELLVDSYANSDRYGHVEGFKVFNSLDGNDEIMDMTEFIHEKIIE